MIATICKKAARIYLRLREACKIAILSTPILPGSLLVRTLIKMSFASSLAYMEVTAPTLTPSQKEKPPIQQLIVAAGYAGIILLPVIGIIICCTGIGIPLGIAFFALAGAMVAVSNPLYQLSKKTNGFKKSFSWSMIFNHQCENKENTQNDAELSNSSYATIHSSMSNQKTAKAIKEKPQKIDQEAKKRHEYYTRGLPFHEKCATPLWNVAKIFETTLLNPVNWKEIIKSKLMLFHNRILKSRDFIEFAEKEINNTFQQ